MEIYEGVWKYMKVYEGVWTLEYYSTVGQNIKISIMAK